jgi:hypothetical protein
MDRRPRQAAAGAILPDRCPAIVWAAQDAFGDALGCIREGLGRQHVAIDDLRRGPARKRRLAG